MNIAYFTLFLRVKMDNWLHWFVDTNSAKFDMRWCKCDNIYIWNTCATCYQRYYRALSIFHWNWWFIVR